MATDTITNGKTFSVDGLQSFVSALGNPEKDKSASAFYVDETISDQMIMAMSRTSWIAKKCISVPAADAFRRWREWQGTPEQIEQIELQEKRLNTCKRLQQTMMLARRWGGAACLMVTDQPLSTPLDPQRIQKGELRYLTPMSRLELEAGPLETDPRSPLYAKPLNYIMRSRDQSKTPDLVIHPSHLIIFIGVEPADPWSQDPMTRGWGDSIFQSTFDPVRNADATAANISSLVYESNVDVFAVPDLMERLGTPQYEDRLLKRFALANAAKGINRCLIHDSQELFDRKQISFAQLPEILEIFLKIVAGALDIPVTRFMGDSPSGLNSTGQGDMKNYYDRVTSEQELDISPAIALYDEVLLRSTFGVRPRSIWYKWAPLEQMNSRQIAEIAKLYSETLRFLKESQVFLPFELRQLAISQFTEQGIFPGIEQITENLSSEEFTNLLIEVLSKIAQTKERQSKAGVVRNSNNTETGSPVRLKPDIPGPNT